MVYLRLSRIKTQWEAALSSGESKLFETFDFLQVTRLQSWLEKKQVMGGYFLEKVFFEHQHKKIALDAYLTETLNRPFVVSTKEKWQQKCQELPWKLTYEGYYPGIDEYSIESLLTVGNGYLAIRGTTPEMNISDNCYPGTYLAGLYNTVESLVESEVITNEDFVNIPNAQKMTLLIDGQAVDFAPHQLLSMTRELDLKTGLFQSWATFAFPDGKQIAVHTQRFVSMAAVQQVHLRYTFKPLNFSGDISFVSEIDGDVYNYNVARYRKLTKHHLQILALEANHAAFRISAQTTQSNHTIVQQGLLRSYDVTLEKLAIEQSANQLHQILPVSAIKGQSYTFEKVIDISQYRKEDEVPSFQWKEHFPTFDEAFSESVKAWQLLWDKAQIVVQGDLMSQKLLNLHTYHLLTSASPNGNQGLDASVTARGLHGEAYRGHIFWDELFILPFYFLHFPETAKELLLYRYRRLAQAKRNAQEAGYAGAMYPWQSGLDGSEQSQKIHLNPVSGQWKEDNSRLQRHVSLAVAYNIWQYWNQTHDAPFMHEYGLEMLLEIAHFWQSIARFDPNHQRYSIENVMGPDEFHEKYPSAQKGGLKNNAYTNMMVVWLFETIETLTNTFDAKILDEQLSKISAPKNFLQKMKEIKHQLYLEINEDGIIAQFEGYFKLKELDWAAYQAKYSNIYRMDRLLNAEGLSADDYQVAKQADTLMIFYNLSKKQVDHILTDLNYTLPEDYVEQNLAYYLARTTHGSTLSRIVHAQLAAIVKDDALTWRLFQEALSSDYHDIQGGTTAEGIHAGVMAATLWIPLSTFAGLDLRQGTVTFRPRLPEHWEMLRFNFTWRKMDFHVCLTSNCLEITSSHDCEITLFEQTVFLQKQLTKIVHY